MYQMLQYEQSPRTAEPSTSRAMGSKRLSAGRSGEPLTRVGFVEGSSSVRRGEGGGAGLGGPRSSPAVPLPTRLPTKARCLYETEKAMKIAYFVQERE